jgi:uncharacterized damage-inducible protein DinB
MSAPEPASTSADLSASPAEQDAPAPTGERAELLRMLHELRHNLLITVRGLDDAQAAARSTVSELTLGGILSHLAQGEYAWTHIMLGRPGTPDRFWDLNQYRMPEGATIAGLIERYQAAARVTDEAIMSLDDLNAEVPLPEAPWAPGAIDRWSPRRIVLHLMRETAQHAGHADIIRESLDGASTTAQLLT